MPESLLRGRLIGAIASYMTSWTTAQLERTETAVRLRGFHAIRISGADHLKEVNGGVADLRSDVTDEGREKDQVIELAVFKRRRSDE